MCAFKFLSGKKGIGVSLLQDIDWTFLSVLLNINVCKPFGIAFEEPVISFPSS